MKAFINGEVVELTKKEEQDFLKEISKIEIPMQHVITDKDRLSALENAFAEFVLSLTGGDIQ